jgi:hypothetical protein
VTLDAFIREVVDGGITAARRDYAGADEHHRQMREGAVRGFEECRGKEAFELALLRGDATERADQAFRAQAPDYWYWRCRAAEVEWVCNCVSAVLHNQGLPTIVPPTARGVMRAAEIVGVQS